MQAGWELREGEMEGKIAPNKGEMDMIINNMKKCNAFCKGILCVLLLYQSVLLAIDNVSAYAFRSMMWHSFPFCW